MAKKKKAPTKATRAKRQKAINRAKKAVDQAHRNLDLKLKKHKQVMSAMWYGL